MKTMPSGSFVFSKISVERLNSLDREASSILNRHGQVLRSFSIFATKFWSEKKMVSGMESNVLCSVVQLTHSSLDGADRLIEVVAF